MSGMRRRALGVLLIIAAPVAVAIGYVNAPVRGRLQQAPPHPMSPPPPTPNEPNAHMGRQE